MAKKPKVSPELELPTQLAGLTLPPEKINGENNPEFYRQAYGAIFKMTMAHVGAGDRVPFNAESVVLMIDRMAKAAGFDPAILRDRRTDAEKIAEFFQDLRSDPDNFWAQAGDTIDAVLGAKERQMDNADKMCLAEIDGRINGANEEEPPDSLPKVWRSRLERLRRLRDRAQHPIPKWKFDGLALSNGDVKRKWFAAAWPLRLMVYCGRSNMPERVTTDPAMAIYSIAKHHAKMASDVWEAREGIRYGRPLSNPEGLPTINYGEIPYEGCILVCPPGHGKPLDVDTPILMGSGVYKRLGDIHVGETVISHAGVPRRVLEVFEQGALPCVKITTQSGRTVVSAKTHPFLTADGWKMASELTSLDVLAIPSNILTQPTSKIGTAESRLIGYIVGDGNVTKTTHGNGFHARITSATTETIDAVTRCAAEMGFGVTLDKTNTRATSVRLTNGNKSPQKWLVSSGLAGLGSYDKRVPESVFAGGSSAAAQYIAGHFETDGCVNAKGKSRDDCCVELYSVSRDLLVDVQRLLVRLGIHSAIRHKNGRYRGAVHHSWRLSISDRHNTHRFRSSIPVSGPKAERLNRWDIRPTRFDGPFISDPIVSVEPHEDRPCRCLTVEHDHTFLANDLVVHNTECGRFIVATFYAENETTQALLAHAQAKEAEKNLGYLASLFSMDNPAGKRFVSLFGIVHEQANATSFRIKLKTRLRQPSGWAGGVKAKVSGANASIIWGDDIVDQKEAEQESERKRTFTLFNGSWLTRLRGKKNFLLITQTLWHQADAVATYIQLARDRKAMYRVSIQRCGGPKTSPQFKPLWPEVYPAEKLRAFYERMRSASLYSAAYMSNPVSDESRIVKCLRLYNPIGDEHAAFLAGSTKYMSLDPAATRGERSDRAGVLYAALGQVVVTTQDGPRTIQRSESRLRLISADSIPATQSDLVAHVVNLCKFQTVDYVMVESRSGYHGTGDMFENYHGIDVIRLDPGNRNKEERLRAAAPAIEDANADLGLRAVVEFPGVPAKDKSGLRILLEDGSPKLDIDPRFHQLSEEILAFGVCATDDQVDALTQMVNRLALDLGIGSGGIVTQKVRSSARSGPSVWLTEQLERAEKGPPKLPPGKDLEQWTADNWTMPKINDNSPTGFTL